VVLEVELRRLTKNNFFLFFLCFVPVPKLNRDIKLFFIPVGPPGINARDILSRHPNPGWKTGTKACSQPGQLKCSVVVTLFLERMTWHSCNCLMFCGYLVTLW